MFEEEVMRNTLANSQSSFSLSAHLSQVQKHRRQEAQEQSRWKSKQHQRYGYVKQDDVTKPSSGKIPKETSDRIWDSPPLRAVTSGEAYTVERAGGAHRAKDLAEAICYHGMEMQMVDAIEQTSDAMGTPAGNRRQARQSNDRQQGHTLMCGVSLLIIVGILLINADMVNSWLGHRDPPDGISS